MVMASNDNPKYQMTIDLNVLNHLGINLYSNVPAVLSEVVANAWDADAERVDVRIDVEADEIIIEDDGHGMGLSDINKKFLNVGYARRENGETKTPKHNRDVMGRKGIGKLSLFSVADKIYVFSVNSSGDKNGFLLDSNEIQRQISSSKEKPYYPEDISCADISLVKGTRIVLKELKKKINQTEVALRRRLSRRFSVISSENNFEVSINNVPIKVEDRDYFHKIQYLWYYGEESKNYVNISKKAEKTELRKNLVNGEFKITGWIGLVKESNQLQDEYDNLNKISLLMRGKMSKEDMLYEFREGGLYAKYLFGEIRADFLDEDSAPDIATSSRQGIVEEDSRFKALKDFVWEELKHIQRKREEYKSEEGESEALKIKPIEEWYLSLTGDAKKKAKSLFSKINQITVDEKHRRELFSHGVLAFESFRYKDALDALDELSTDNLDEFLKIFKEFDEIEATLYYKITRERLQIIDNLKKKVHDENALEKILQEYLFNYLWLLDPAWDRATENAYMEERAMTEFEGINAKLTPDEASGRIDIKYKKTSGKHIIIELKRASVKTDVNSLLGQVDKYRTALKKLIRTAGELHPVIETICIVGKPLKGWDDDLEKEEEDRKQMDAKSTRLITYQQLINDSYNSYKDYMEKNQEAGRLLDLIKQIENSVQFGE